MERGWGSKKRVPCPVLKEIKYSMFNLQRDLKCIFTNIIPTFSKDICKRNYQKLPDSKCSSQVTQSKTFIYCKGSFPVLPSIPFLHSSLSKKEEVREGIKDIFSQSFVYYLLMIS